MNGSPSFPAQGNGGRSPKKKNQSKAPRSRGESKRKRQATAETEAGGKPPKKRTGRPPNPPRVNRPPAVLLPRPPNSSPDSEPCLTPRAAPTVPDNYGCLSVPHGKGPPSGHPLPMPPSQHQPSVSANGRRRGLQPLDLVNLGPDEMTGSVMVLGQYAGGQSFEFSLFDVLGSPHWSDAFMDPDIADGLGLPISQLGSPRTFLTPCGRFQCTHEVVMQCKSEDFGLQLGPLRAFLFRRGDPPLGPSLILPMESEDRVLPQNVYNSINNNNNNNMVVEQHPFALSFFGDASSPISRHMGVGGGSIPYSFEGEYDHNFIEGFDSYLYSQAFVEDDSEISAANHFGIFGEVDSNPSYGEFGSELDLGDYDNGDPSGGF